MFTSNLQSCEHKAERWIEIVESSQSIDEIEAFGIAALAELNLLVKIADRLGIHLCSDS